MLNCLKTGKSSAKSCTLVCLGLEKTGKTSLIRFLSGERDPAAPSPTFGFNLQNFSYKQRDFTVIDCGGASQYRLLWEFYFDKVDGVIFVLDAADPHRLEEAGAELVKLLSSEELSNKPLLIFNNKQDQKDAVSEEFVKNFFGLGAVEDRDLLVCDASASSGRGVYEGFSWILKSIFSLN